MLRWICKTAVLLGLLGLGAHRVHAQAIAESATMTSQSTIAAQSAKRPLLTTANPPKRSASAHLIARTGPPPDAVNRQDFEENAGEKAGKLLLRSVPVGAEIFINDRLVGRTPLLMVIAPGKYNIDMRGQRQESGHSTVGVMPQETQTVVIQLSVPYPTSITIR